MKEFKLTTPNAIVRYHDLPGEEVPIIFVHGLGCASSFDYPQVAAMPELICHRRIIVDLLGSGFSDKPKQFSYQLSAHAEYLAALIDHLGLSQVVVFGHSMGGAVAIELASRLGDKLHSIILTEANLDSGGGFFSKQIVSFSEQEFVESGYDKVIEESKASGNTEWAAG
ncbi:alpha/beta fold hydrolase [Vibrio sonorensis]|uniref:alpha/beta fold hydrolase n=1 Tax=Vibrio sonorensis TaxID=1004316 RepID=UPI000B2DF8A4|nr:alpha/beta hydrolase [Vibrio sonorensis]